MKKTTLKKLYLGKESLRGLDDDKVLSLVAGQASAQSCGESCTCASH